MHNHRSGSLLSQLRRRAPRSRASARNASTAAALKQPQWSSSHQDGEVHVSVPKPNLNKWSLPERPTSQASSSGADSRVVVPRPNMGKWSLPGASELPSNRSAGTVSRNASRESAKAPQTSSPPETPPETADPSSSNDALRASSTRRAPSSPSDTGNPRPVPPHFNPGMLSRTRDPLPHHGQPPLSSIASKPLLSGSRGRGSQDRRRQPAESLVQLLRPRATPQRSGRWVKEPEQQDSRKATNKNKQDGKSVSQLDDADIEEDSIVFEESDRDDRRGKRRDVHSKTAFKTRGSIVAQLQENATELALSRNHRAKEDKRSKARQAMERSAKLARVDVIIPKLVAVEMLARLLHVRIDALLRKMEEAGMVEEARPDYVLTSDYASLLAEEFGRNPMVDDEASFDIYPSSRAEQSTLPPRPPIVTIMGHVDHGKTTLLDTLRSASVAKGEAGGITQHIGAFSVPVKTSEDSDDSIKTITFLDTPGHAAFSAMRARGAVVTDVIVLVVAADDGIMPQTREVLQLVKKEEGKVCLVVAINKVDKPGADPEMVQAELLNEGIQLESLGGDVPSVAVSGLTGKGLSELVETISAVAELQDLRAERGGPVHGLVLESKVQHGLGSVATVLVTRGCLKPTSSIIAGTAWARVRLMKDSAGNMVKEAYPGMAVTVSGWKELPDAGDEVLQGSENEVKKAAANRIRRAALEAELKDMNVINASRKEERERRETEEELEKLGEVLLPEPQHNGPKELRLVVKGDVTGSVEAFVGAIKGVGNERATLKVVYTGVGHISEFDIKVAKATRAMVIGFSVEASRPVQNFANTQGVQVHSSRVIYQLIDEVTARTTALLPPIIERHVTGEASVLQLFPINLKGKQTKMVAGCRIDSGLCEKSKRVQILRNGEVIYSGTMDTLKHLKKDVMEVRKGMECGIGIEDFNGVQEGDKLQFYEEISKPAIL